MTLPLSLILAGWAEDNFDQNKIDAWMNPFKKSARRVIKGQFSTKTMANKENEEKHLKPAVRNIKTNTTKNSQEWHKRQAKNVFDSKKKGKNVIRVGKNKDKMTKDLLMRFDLLCDAPMYQSFDDNPTNGTHSLETKSQVPPPIFVKPDFRVPPPQVPPYYRAIQSSKKTGNVPRPRGQVSKPLEDLRPTNIQHLNDFQFKPRIQRQKKPCRNKPYDTKSSSYDRVDVFNTLTPENVNITDWQLPEGVLELKSPWSMPPIMELLQGEPFSFEKPPPIEESKKIKCAAQGTEYELPTSTPSSLKSTQYEPFPWTPIPQQEKVLPKPFLRSYSSMVQQEPKEATILSEKVVGTKATFSNPSDVNCAPLLLVNSSPLQDEIENTNKKLKVIKEGCSIDVIAPFVFLNREEFREELSLHKVLWACRSAFSKEQFAMEDADKPDNLGSKELFSLTNELIKKASASKLSVHAEPFTYKPHLKKETVRNLPEIGIMAFMEFVSKIDGHTMRTLVPAESSPLPLYNKETEIEEFHAEQHEYFVTEQHKPERDISSPADLQGEVILPQDVSKDQSTHGAIGKKKQPASDQENQVAIVEQKEKPEEVKIMYGGRDILDLGSNLIGEWSGANRWQLGPMTMRTPRSVMDINPPMDHHHNQDLPPYRQF